MCFFGPTTVRGSPFPSLRCSSCRVLQSYDSPVSLASVLSQVEAFSTVRPTTSLDAELSPPAQCDVFVPCCVCSLQPSTPKYRVVDQSPAIPHCFLGALKFCQNLSFLELHHHSSFLFLHILMLILIIFLILIYITIPTIFHSLHYPSTLSLVHHACSFSFSSSYASTTLYALSCVCLYIILLQRTKTV